MEWLVTSRYKPTLQSQERVKSEVIKAESADEAVIDFTRRCSIAECKVGLRLYVSEVSTTEGTSYWGQYENPDGAVFDGPPLGEFVITRNNPTEVYRG